MNQTKILYSIAMNFAIFYGVNPGRIDVGMTENISKSNHILFVGIVSSGKEVP